MEKASISLLVHFLLTGNQFWSEPEKTHTFPATVFLLLGILLVLKKWPPDSSITKFLKPNHPSDTIDLGKF